MKTAIISGIVILAWALSGCQSIEERCKDSGGYYVYIDGHELCLQKVRGEPQEEKPRHEYPRGK